MKGEVAFFCNGTWTALGDANSSDTYPPPDCSPVRESYSAAENLEFPGYIRATATVFCAIILMLGIAGNALVPLVVCRTKELSNSTNFFLINLSVADLLILIVCMPTVLIELHSQPEVWLLGEGMCKIVPFVELTVAHGSILTMLAISFERFYAICRPFKAGYTCTKMRALVIILVVWLVAVIITGPVLIIVEYTHTDYIDGTDVPVCLTSAKSPWERSYFFVTISFFFFLPFGILVALYGVIAKKLMMDGRRQMFETSIPDSQMRARRQVVMMLAAVISCFFICLMPFRVFTLWLLIVPDEHVQQLGMEAYYNVLYFCRVMLYINSASNPVLYNLISSKFREAFLRLFCGTIPQRLSRHSRFNTTYTSVTFKGSISNNSPCHTCYYASCQQNRKCEESFV